MDNKTKIKEMSQAAIRQLVDKVDKAGHDVSAIKRIGVIFVTNRETGVHCHAAASITLRFDGSCTENEWETMPSMSNKKF